MLHWIPFNEGDFAKLSGYSPNRVLKYIRDDDHYRLAQLLAVKGISVAQGTEQLTRRWMGKVTPEKLTELQRRTSDVLTQGHLAQHVLFHHFHNPLLAVHSREIFGLSRGDYTAARRHGFSPAQMGRRTGRSKRQVKRAALRIMRKYMYKAIRNQETTPAQAHRFYRRQVRYADRWLGQNLRNPKGEKFPRGKKAHNFKVKQELYCAIFVGKRNDGRQLEEK